MEIASAGKQVGGIAGRENGSALNDAAVTTEFARRRARNGAVGSGEDRFTVAFARGGVDGVVGATNGRLAIITARHRLSHLRTGAKPRFLPGAGFTAVSGETALGAGDIRSVVRATPARVIATAERQ